MFSSSSLALLVLLYKQTDKLLNLLEKYLCFLIFIQVIGTQNITF